MSHRKFNSKEKEKGLEKWNSLLRRISAMSFIALYLSIILDLVSIILKNNNLGAIIAFIYILSCLYFISERFGKWIDKKFPNKTMFSDLSGIVSLVSIIMFALEKIALPHFNEEQSIYKIIIIIVILLLAILPIAIFFIMIRKKEFLYNE